MTFTIVFVTIFLVAFVIIGGVVMFLSKTIDHGEARFDASGRVIKDEEPSTGGPVRPAQRVDDRKDER